MCFLKVRSVQGQFGDCNEFLIPKEECFLKDSFWNSNDYCCFLNYVSWDNFVPLCKCSQAHLERLFHCTNLFLELPKIGGIFF